MLFSRLESIETRFNFTTTRAQMQRVWTLSFYVSAFYVLVIFVGRRRMKARARFDLRRLLFAWNLALSLFSAIGAWRVAVPFVVDVVEFGWGRAVCSLDYGDPSQGLWLYLFALSKLPELIDTLFIVLRKQELIFLHWYHHVTVFCYCWWGYAEPFAQVRLFSAMNYVVHAIMYAYYAARAQGIVRLPRFVSVLITTIQIVQMGVGWAACVDGMLRVRSGFPCDVEFKHVFWGLLMYSSYFALFANFFYRKYFKSHAV